MALCQHYILTQTLSCPKRCTNDNASKNSKFVETAMAKWLLEQSLGHSSPFTCKSFRKEEKSLISSCYRQQIVENECSSLEITSIDSDEPIEFIYAYIQNRGVTIPITLCVGKPLVLFSCYDQITMYFYTKRDSRLRMFCYTLQCCQNWHIGSFSALEAGFFGKKLFLETGNDSIKVYCTIANLRSEQEYHYRVIAPGPAAITPPTFSVNVKGQVCRVFKYQCALCLQPLSKLSMLITHINKQHTYYRCAYEDEILVISKVQNDNCISDNEPEDSVLNKEISYIRRNKASEFKNKKALEYGLIRYGCLINSEYERLNYTEILAEYSIQRLIFHPDPEEKSLMKAWNKQHLQSESIFENLKNIIATFGLSMSVLKLIEIIYVSGLLDSSELMAILEGKESFEITTYKKH